jgi:PhnB protein
MVDRVKPIPDGYHVVTPYLIVAGAAAALEFYREVLGGEESFRMNQPDGRVGHAEIRFGDSTIMLADEFPDIGARGPRSLGGSPVSLLIYVEDVDAVVARAVERGAVLKRPIENKFYGDRAGGIEDPWGHAWTIATHVEDVSPEEMERRAKAASS